MWLVWCVRRCDVVLSLWDYFIVRSGALAGIVAVSWVALTKVVVRFEPFQRTVEPFTKFVPLTVNVNPPPPAVAEFGERLVVVGTGLLIVNV